MGQPDAGCSTAGTAGIAAARSFLAHTICQTARRLRGIYSPEFGRQHASKTPQGTAMTGFFELLRVQRWDDHRYYHHSRVNQSLHLLSAISFVCSYAVMFDDPAMAALIGWLISMTSRQ